MSESIIKMSVTTLSSMVAVTSFALAAMFHPTIVSSSADSELVATTNMMTAGMSIGCMGVLFLSQDGPASFFHAATEIPVIDRLPHRCGSVGADWTDVWINVNSEDPGPHLAACPSRARHMADTTLGVGVFPIDRLGSLGIGVDVAAELAGQVGGGGEDAACYDVTLHLGEPQLDLVEPGRVGGSEV